MLHRRYLLLFFIVLFPFLIQAQSISGQVLDDMGQPIPFANIFVNQLATGTSTDFDGNYYLQLGVGEFELIYSALGYETKSIKLFVDDQDVTRNVILQNSNVELEEIVVKASKKDPAYEIIRKAIANKKKYLKQLQSFQTQVYVKATENIEDHRKEKKEAFVTVGDETELDPFEAEENEKQQLAGNLNILEMQLRLSFEYPNKFKEERTAYKAYGSKAGLFIPNFGLNDLNFYRNQVYMRDIAQMPLISPLSRTAILSYKYKLIESIPDRNGRLVYKIKVIPRKSGNATCKGYIYINDELWNINRVDLSFPKGGLKLYDGFTIKQDYEAVEDSLWIPMRQEFVYETKQGKKKTFKGTTILRYTDFEKDIDFPAKFFGNEIAVTTKEAYKRDTSYWQQVRTEPLTVEEQQVIEYRDSLEILYNSPAYKDSVQAAYNKVTPLEVLWDGVGFRNYLQRQHLYINSLSGLLEFEVVGGFRLGPYLSYFKRWDNGQMLNTSINPNIGLRNGDLQGTHDIWFRYNPHKLADVELNYGRSFASINSFDAYITQLSVSNYILHDAMRLKHRIELFNGFYWSAVFSFSERRSVANLNSRSFLDDIVPENQPLAFEDYQTMITSMSIAYTPGQKYMTEPDRKVILGSKYPTFNLHYKKGWNKLLSSDIDFDFLEVIVDQDLQLGALGNSKYRFNAGKFLNTNEVTFVDLKRFRQSDPILYSNPLRSFQLLDTALATTNLFLEFHHIHHFNGALINNIPLVKKLRFQVVAGAGFLWVPDQNVRHEEVFAGLERVFKLGPRRRLRVGVYGVAANSNYAPTQLDWKVSFDIIDTWKRDWSF